MQMALGILEERADEALRERLLDLREEADQMSSLVNELLSFSKTALGGSGVQRRSVELRPIAERAAQREGASRIEIAVPQGLGALADSNLLERALANLLRNALRYAGNCGPVAVLGDRAGDAVSLTVRDNGPGVPEDMLEQIFDPFFRVDSARTRESGGVGLGLAIVKTCVTSCGGTVSCRNLRPSGFEVTIRLATSE
jgi:two-component system sensor histidine kinase CpxA